MTTTPTPDPGHDFAPRHCLTCGAMIPAGLECLDCCQRRMEASEGRLGGTPRHNAPVAADIADAPTLILPALRPATASAPASAPVAEALPTRCVLCGETTMAASYPFATLDGPRILCPDCFSDLAAAMQAARLDPPPANMTDWPVHQHTHVTMQTTEAGRADSGSTRDNWRAEIHTIMGIWGPWLDPDDGYAA